MIVNSQGNLLEAKADALVNTVNCVGYMGKGIALQFKKAFPDNFSFYEKACRENRVRPGEMLVFDTGTIFPPRYIINFPTKQHWREKSRIEYISEGLKSLVREIAQRPIRSIAIPPLGCGNGGLNWDRVRPLIENAFQVLPDVEVLLFAPAGAPAAHEMPINTERPHLTLARALLIRLMQDYKTLDYSLTLLEIQKLAYFLQISGEPLRLRYEAGHYGPYAPNLKKVLEVLEGHFITGYGDSERPEAELRLLPGAIDVAEAFLKPAHPQLGRLEKVRRLIEGFETPYGLELLASVHWVTTKRSTRDISEIVTMIHEWNARKRALMQPKHIAVAYDRLAQHGWIEPLPQN